jgi:predicted nucleotidyltransferase
MYWRERPESDLSELARVVYRVEGVIAAILFGSRARGDYDEHSDLDVLVVFESDEARRKNWDKLYEEVSKTGLFTQVLARSLRELQEKTDPTFLREVLKHGIFLHKPAKLPAPPRSLKSMSIIMYSLKNLFHKDKQKVCYRLFGKQSKGYSYEGTVTKLGGLRLGDGCIMVPEKWCGEIVKILDEYKVRHRVISVYVARV